MLKLRISPTLGVWDGKAWPSPARLFKSRPEPYPAQWAGPGRAGPRARAGPEVSNVPIMSHHDDFHLYYAVTHFKQPAKFSYIIIPMGGISILGISLCIFKPYGGHPRLVISSYYMAVIFFIFILQHHGYSIFDCWKLSFGTSKQAISQKQYTLWHVSYSWYRFFMDIIIFIHFITDITLPILLHHLAPTV